MLDGKKTENEKLWDKQTTGEQKWSLHGNYIIEFNSDSYQPISIMGIPREDWHRPLGVESWNWISGSWRVLDD